MMDGESGTDTMQGPVAVEEEIIFLEPGQEKAQNIVKAISHHNAGESMQLLSSEGPMKLSDIASRMGLSTNAAKYHVENLKNAGLIEIANTRYSVKGKKMKVYRLKNQVFIVAPNMTSGPALRAVLLKYATLCGIFIVAFGVILLQPFVVLTYGPVSSLTGSSSRAQRYRPPIRQHSSRHLSLRGLSPFSYTPVLKFSCTGKTGSGVLPSSPTEDKTTPSRFFNVLLKKGMLPGSIFHLQKMVVSPHRAGTIMEKSYRIVRSPGEPGYSFRIFAEHRKNPHFLSHRN